MVNRYVLKERAKRAFRSNYWKCVLAALIATIFLGSAVSQRQNAPAEVATTSQGETISAREAMEDSLVLIPGLLAIGLTAGTAGTLIKIFVFSPLEIGVDSFFTQNAMKRGELGQILDGFRGDYLRNVLAMFLRDLFIALWTLLLIFPGLMKVYSYRLVPYILAESPELSRKEVFRLSQELMYGKRWDTFVLDLSFIGWNLLSVLTAGLLGIFYVNPYVRATGAELYLSLRYE